MGSTTGRRISPAVSLIVLTVDEFAPLPFPLPLADARTALRAAFDACIVSQARIDRPVDKRRASHPLSLSAPIEANWAGIQRPSQRVRDVGLLYRMDTLGPSQRSERMSRVRGKDTVPELMVRRLVHGMGYRYRLHRRDLPGRPDLVFATRRKVIFVHGCFWHRHGDSACKLARLPKSRLEFWLPKLEANKARDAANQERLLSMAWNFLVIWECQLAERALLEERIRGFLGA
jgi:DNA mismatch endonuclease (patch repair protein)